MIANSVIRNSLLSLVFVFALTGHIIAQSRVGASRSVDPNANVATANILPITQYIAIDASKNSLSDPVTHVALDDAGKVAFCAVVPTSEFTGYVDVNLFVNGQIVELQSFETSDITWARCYQAYPEYLRANGEVLGSYARWERLPDATDPPSWYSEDYALDFWGGSLASRGRISELGLTYPFYNFTTNKHHNTGNWYGASETGFATSQRWSEFDLAGQPKYILCPPGEEGYGCPYVSQIVCKDGISFFDGELPNTAQDIIDPQWFLKFRKQKFSPINGLINDQGNAVGYRYWWNGQAVASTNLPDGCWPWSFTNDNRMGVVDYTNPEEGMLWENGAVSYFRDLLQHNPFASQLRNIIPRWC